MNTSANTAHEAPSVLSSDDVVEIRCCDRTFIASASTLAAKSDFFSRLLSSPFRESQTRTVTLEDEIPYYITLMLDYIFKGDYNDGVIPDAENHPSYSDIFNEHSFKPEPEAKELAVLWSQLTNISMYAIGEKFLCPGLKHHAVNKFRSHNVRLWVHSIPELLEKIYKETSPVDNNLRKFIAVVCAKLSYRLEEDEEVEYEAVLRDIPEAGRDIHRASRAIIRARHIEAYNIKMENVLLKMRVEIAEKELEMERQLKGNKASTRCNLVHVGVTT